MTPAQIRRRAICPAKYIADAARLDTHEFFDAPEGRYEDRFPKLFDARMDFYEENLDNGIALVEDGRFDDHHEVMFRLSRD
jgi:hypothetical protein